MRLTTREFWAMNHPIRHVLQRHVEFRKFKKMGLDAEGRDILEIGCGSGYGAVLLTELHPRSYVGVDLMLEQIELARKRTLPNVEFLVMDASDLSRFPDCSKDIIVIFGVLHHVPKWRAVVRECYRVLRGGGRFFVEEPEGMAVHWWDRVFKWNHPQEALFSLKQFEDTLVETGFTIVEQLRMLLAFGVYHAQKPEISRKVGE